MHTQVSDAVLGALQFQRDASTSALYRVVLEATAADIAAGGPCADVLGRVDPNLSPIADAVLLRFLAGVHGVVLDGTAPDLAAHYPSAGGHFDPDAPDPAIADVFVATVAAHRDAIIEALERPVQTNEVGRSAVLLLGYLEVARATGLPLRVLELGASAGLNLRWDHYRYEGGRDGSAWGDVAAPLRFSGCYVDPLPDLALPAEVVERGGCDAHPIDAATPDGRAALRAFLWPDQLERYAALEGALTVAEAVPVTIEHVDAADFVDAQLAQPRPGVATVITHSIVWQYLPAETRRRIFRRLQTAGESASASAPLAWLRMEPGDDPAKSAEVRLQQWPGGPDRVLARAGYHGRPIRTSTPG